MRKKVAYGYLMLAPVMIILVSIFVMGIVESIAQSLGYFPAIGKYEWSLKYYIEVFTQDQFLKSFLYSLSFSFVSAFGGAILGIVISYYLVGTEKGDRLVENILRVPIYVPHIVAVALMYMIFNQTGIIARIFYYLGIIQEPSEFPVFMQDHYGIGIVIVYIWKGIPFVVMTVLGILRSIDTTLVVVAKNLGASSKNIFWRIQLPIILPSVMSSFIILFAFSFGAFEVPYLIGANNPKALPVLAYLEHTSGDVEQRIYAMVLNVIMIGVSFILLGCYMRVNDKIKKYR